MARIRCGALTQRRTRCAKEAMTGTSRCHLHQGAWSPYGVARRKQAQARAALRRLRKQR